METKFRYVGRVYVECFCCPCCGECRCDARYVHARSEPFETPIDARNWAFAEAREQAKDFNSIIIQEIVRVGPKGGDRGTITIHADEGTHSKFWSRMPYELTVQEVADLG